MTARAAQTPVLSVVVPARDAAPWIGELLDSVLAQAVADCEVLVVDNGSTDGTAEIVAAVAARSSEVRLIRSAATSAAEARNEGVAAATGEYLVFADADDIVPDGAYRAMLDSLRASGSDMVIGDHLKFSPIATWSPTARWWPFDRAMQGVVPGDVPQLLSTRACWNRMFRRSFWDAAGLRFPEIPNIDDIGPMTRAFVAAERIDVVPDCVLLYRERDSGTSLSTRDDAATTVRYLTEERRCAELVAGHPTIAAVHAEVVFDADGWVHLSRYLRGAGTVDPEVVAAARALLAEVPRGHLASAAAHRRMMWALVAQDSWAEAAAFARATDASAEQRTTEGGDGTARIRAWADAVSTLRGVGDPAGLADGLADDGLVVALVNDAESADVDVLAARLAVVRSTLGGERSPSDVIPAAMVRAVHSGTAADVRAVSRLRRAAPVVVDTARPGQDGLVIGGPAGVLGGFAPVLRLVNGDERADVPISFRGGDRWEATVRPEDLVAGRWTVAVVAEVGDDRIDLPVVTARMPLPPLGPEHVLQPLADRAAGWRFLVDRRPDPSGGVRRLVGSALRRMRRS